MPLLERLRYLCIVSSNLDEFFEVRIASLLAQGRLEASRVEAAFPVLDSALKKRVIAEGLDPYLKDNTKAWELALDGTYLRKKPRGRQTPFCAQQYLMQSLGRLGAAPDGG